MSMTFAAARRRSSIALRRLAQTACTLSHASLSTSPTSSSASLHVRSREAVTLLVLCLLTTTVQAIAAPAGCQQMNVVQGHERRRTSSPAAYMFLS